MALLTGVDVSKYTIDFMEIPVYKSYHFLRPVWRKERYGCNHALSILRSGLLFREDSVRLEVSLLRGSFPPPNLLEGYSIPEAFMGTLGAAACLAVTRYVARPLSVRSALIGLTWAALAALVPLTWRCRSPQALPHLLQVMNAHTRRWRRHPLPLERGAKLCVALGSANQALVRACPWLQEDPQELEWEQGPHVFDALALRDAKKLYHLYLVLQSSFLRRIAMAHALPDLLPRDLTADMPRRIVWIHDQLLPAVRACLVNYLTPITPPAVSPEHRPILPNGTEEDWKYSQLHNSITELSAFLENNARLCCDIDLKMEGFRLNEADLKLEDYQRGLERLKEGIVKSVKSIEAITDEVISLLLPEGAEGIRDDGRDKLIKELVEKKEDEVVRVVSEETEMEIEDQCFYYEKKDDGENIIVGDIPGGPGAREMDAAKAVLGELRQRLVEREDTMRARETAALVRTMPELKDNMPEFPRQMPEKEDHLVEKADNTPKKQDKPDIPQNEDNITEFSKQIPETRNNLTELSRQLMETESRLDKEIGKLIPEAVREKETVKTAKSKIDNDSNPAEKLAENDRDNFERRAKQLKAKEIVEEIIETAGKVVKDKLSKDNSNKEPEISRKLNEKTKEKQNLINAEKSKIMVDQVFEHSGSDTEDSSEGSGLLKDVRKGRVSRKKNHPPSRNGSLKLKKASNGLWDLDSVDGTNQKDKENGRAPDYGGVRLPDDDGHQKDYSRRGYRGVHRPEDPDDSWRPSQPSLGAGLAMASLLAGGLKGALGDEDTFTGEGEQEPDSGNEE